MNPIQSIRSIAAVGLVVFAGSAAAHTGGHAVVGFVSGLTHPLLGLDHLLAMFAVGLWAAQQGGRALWAVPAAFVAAMAGGGALTALGVGLPHVETAISVSVLVLGLLVATRQQWAAPAGMALAAGFALFHGYAHGTEMPLAASPLLYALGFVLATAGLHAAGIAASLLGHRAMRVAGFGIAATGAALVFGL
jgi:urease accessory protein